MEMWKGKNVLITGAASGIGKALAEALAEKDACLFLTDKNVQELSATADSIRKKFKTNVFEFAMDVSKEKDWESARKQFEKELGNLFVLVNCAGFGIYREAQETNMDEYRELMNVNFMGTVLGVKTFLEKLKTQKSGHIVNIASVAGKIAFPNYSAYCASKFAVVGFTESMHFELKGTGVQVHLVCPAGTQTKFFNHPSFEGHAHRKHPEKMMKAEQVAQAILKGLERNQFEIVVPWKEQLVLTGKALLPGMFRKIQERRHMQRKNIGKK